MHTGSPVQGNAPDGVFLSKIPTPSGCRSGSNRREPPTAETRDVNKSVLAIGVIGIAGCVLLSSMMKELALQKKPPRPTWLVSLEVEFGDQLVGRLAAHEEDDRGLARLVVNGTAKAGGDRAALALAIANSASRLLRDGNSVSEVQVTLRDPDGKDPKSAFAPRARPPR